MKSRFLEYFAIWFSMLFVTWFAMGHKNELDLKSKKAMFYLFYTQTYDNSSCYFNILGSWVSEKRG